MNNTNPIDFNKMFIEQERQVKEHSTQEEAEIIEEKPEEKEDNSIDKIRKTIELILEDNNPRHKKSIFYKLLNKEEMIIILSLIETNQITYKKGFEFLKNKYNKDVPELKTVKWRAFYNFITTHILNNQTQGYYKHQDLINNLVENKHFMKKITENEYFITKIAEQLDLRYQRR
jgi:hypothetical protein